MHILCTGSWPGSCPHSCLPTHTTLYNLGPHKASACLLCTHPMPLTHPPHFLTLTFRTPVMKAS
jgi:hypothetical protein